MAEKAGISRNTLAKMGKNEYIAVEMIERICMKLGLPIKDVLEVRCDDPTGNRSGCRHMISPQTPTGRGMRRR